MAEDYLYQAEFKGKIKDRNGFSFVYLHCITDGDKYYPIQVTLNDGEFSGITINEWHNAMHEDQFDDCETPEQIFKSISFSLAYWHETIDSMLNKREFSLDNLDNNAEKFEWIIEDFD